MKFLVTLHVKTTTAATIVTSRLGIEPHTFGNVSTTPGADPGFQVRGGGGALKKIASSGGRREHFWGISCEKSRFYAKKSYFFQLPREARKFLRYFVWKITILRQKIIFFPILGGGGRAGCAPLPWIRPCTLSIKQKRSPLDQLEKMSLKCIMIPECLCY